MKIPIEKVVFKPELWPREEADNRTVELYRLNVDKLPAIILNEDHILVDGYHRLLAHKLEGRAEIECKIVSIPEDQIPLEAARLNRDHGKQLSFKEKQRFAIWLREQKNMRQAEISKMLAVDKSTVSKWLQNVEQIKRKERGEKIMSMYLQCYTHKEIAAQIGIPRRTLTKTVQNLSNQLTNEIGPKPPDSLQFSNVWHFPSRDPDLGLKHKGNIPGQIIENLLYYFTRPFDLVVDPMAGGGPTVDACKRWYRRYRTYDLNPERDDIGKWDIKNGYPKK